MPQNYVITTVTVPATCFDLTTLIDTKADLEIDDSDPAIDIYLKRVIRQVSAAVSQYCNRVFALQTYQDQLRPLFESSALPCPGRYQPLLVARTPLVEVTEIVVDGTSLVADTDYEVDLERGEIWRLDGSGNQRGWAPLKTVVTYRAGWTLPGLSAGDNKLLDTASDIEDAAIRVIKARYLSENRDPLLMSVSQPNLGDRRYWVGATPGQDATFPPEIACILDNYRVPVMA